MPSEECVLLLSRTAGLAPVVRRVASERRWHFLRAADPGSAYERLRSERIACALLDLDTLGEATEEFLRRLRGLRPDLRVLGFGGTQARAARPAARRLGVPLLARPLTAARLARALAEDEVATGSQSARAARLLLDTTHEELRRRIGQLTTLYQLGRAISESRDWSEALDYFLATLKDYLGVEGAALLLWSRESTRLAPRTVLGLSPETIDTCVATLRGAFPVRQPSAEIHPLSCYQPAAAGGLRCGGHADRWRLTVLPLLYRRTPLGFLVLDKPYAGGADFASELFFLQTIQTILGEEVANAVHLSRLVDLKNFNAAVLDNVESGVLTVNGAGQVTFANRLARRILGLAPEGELPERLAFADRFLLPGSPPWPALVADGATWDGEARRTDGGRVPVVLRTRRITDPSDSEPLVVVAFEDLTERRALEEQARRADRLRSLGEIAAAIAHEVRNPLQGISLTLSNLQEHLSPAGAPYVQVIFGEMERLNAIVGGILAFARPVPPQPAEFELTALCARARELATERAARRSVRLHQAPLPAEDRCEADEGQILQVVLNLLLNAIDASPPGGEVRLECTAIPGPDGAPLVWRLAVHDDGPGVPPAARPKLFDPFFTTKSDGTGMGLAVSQKIVEEHRGTIHVDTGGGEGTTFSVFLPRRFGAALAARAG